MPCLYASLVPWRTAKNGRDNCCFHGEYLEKHAVFIGNVRETNTVLMGTDGNAPVLLGIISEPLLFYGEDVGNFRLSELGEAIG